MIQRLLSRIAQIVRQVRIGKMGKEEDKEELNEHRNPPELWGTRHTYVVMAFLGYTLCFTLR